jgi:hypothetical protein
LQHNGVAVDVDPANRPIVDKMARHTQRDGNALRSEQLALTCATHHERQFWNTGTVMLKDRENILNALREKPLKAYQLMRRANLPNEEACQSLLLKMRDEGLVKFDIHKGLWTIG